MVKKNSVTSCCYDGLVEPLDELCEEMETVRGFCYFGDRVNASVVAR